MIASILLVALPALTSLGAASPLARRQGVTESVSSVRAAPTFAWDEGATPDWRIHSSCNTSERGIISRGLYEMKVLAQHANDHILRYGNESEFYQKYFGAAPSGEVIGWYQKLISADRGQFLFRCDNPDGNCDIPTYNGHWRGENGTDQTVICPLSYVSRWRLDEVCLFGYTVAGSNPNSYLASDLIHRMFHMPKAGEGVVEHYSDGYLGALELAETDPANATRNTETLNYFALDVWAYDIAVPGEGCTGEPSKEETATASPTSSAAPPTSTAPTTTATAPPTTTQSAGQECHTHADGTEHCT